MSGLLRVLGVDVRRPSCIRARGIDSAETDAGFSLVETVVALSIFALLMTSTAVVFVGGIRSSAAVQRRQTATTLAAQAIELARAVPPAPDTNQCPRLLQGRSQSAVSSQVVGLPTDVDLSGTDVAWMPNTCSGSTVIPLQGLASVAGAAPLDPVRVDGYDYTLRTVIGTCRMPRSGGSCVTSLAAPLDAVSLFRVVVSVSWSGVGCAQGCSYSAATLIDPSSDPLFNPRTTTPGPPVNLSAAAGDASAVLAWQAPTTALEVPVIRYTATLTPKDGGSAKTCTVAAPMVTCTATGLTNGVTYVASVVAESAYGLSSPSSTVTVIPYPAGIMSAARVKLWLDGADGGTLFQDSTCTTPATAVAQQVLCWKDKSVSLNNALQTVVASAPKLSTVATRPVPGFDGSASSLILTPSLLPIGTSTGTIVAVATSTDPSPSSSGLRAVVNHGTLSGGAARQIQKLANSSARVVSVGTNAVQSTWTTAPGIVAGEFTASSITNWSDGGPGTTVTGLTNSTGTTYARIGSSGTPAQFWYGAIPEVIVFLGSLTTTERRTVEEYLARKWGTVITPQAPTGVAAVGGALSASVSWTPPAWDGGGAISSYTIVATPATGPVVTKTGCASSPCTVSGLSAAMPYSFTVAAVNSAGTGPASLPATATTLGGPGAPTALVANPGDTTLGVAWTPPASNGGSPITGYTVTATPAGGGSSVGCTTATTGCTLTGLTDGVAYIATVTATTAIGTSPASTPITSIPYPSALITSATVQLWLDASDLDANGAVGGTTGETGTVGGAVQTWKDRSGGARDTTAPSALERPSYVTRTINGLPVVTTTGTQVLNGAVSASPYGITGDRTLVVVTRPRVWTGGTAASGDGTYLVDRANGSNGTPLFGLKVCGTSYCIQHRTDAGGTATTVTGTTGPQVGSTDILLAIRSGSTDTLVDTGSVVGSATLSGTITQQGRGCRQA